VRRGRLALVWSTDTELAEAAAAALEVAGYSALVPGYRSLPRLCRTASLIVVDERDAAYLPRGCSVPRRIELAPSAAEAAAELLARLNVPEAILGIDPGRVSTGYALLAGSSLVHGAVLTGGQGRVAEKVCGIVRRGPSGLLIGIGAAPAVADIAVGLAEMLRGCGASVALVDERGSNHEAPLGLRRLKAWQSTHIRAAAAIALRARIHGMSLASLGRL
jgi:hypothetical protein